MTNRITNMAIMPPMVFTRRIALLAEYGIDPFDVPQSGFTHEHFDVIGVLLVSDFAKRPGSVSHIYASGNKPLTRVGWAEDDVERARQAINDDLAETYGRPLPE
jgi:hypothetical protein